MCTLQFPFDAEAEQARAALLQAKQEKEDRERKSLVSEMDSNVRTAVLAAFAKARTEYMLGSDPIATAIFDDSTPSMNPRRLTDVYMKVCPIEVKDTILAIKAEHEGWDIDLTESSSTYSIIVKRL